MIGFHLSDWVSCTLEACFSKHQTILICRYVHNIAFSQDVGSLQVSVICGQIVEELSQFCHLFVTETGESKIVKLETERQSMTTALRIDWRPVEGGLPEDLSWYIGKKTLVKLILEAIDEGGLAGAGGDNVATEAMAFQPALLLTLLTYCYATGVYASIDIELGLRHDQMIRYLCANACPGFQVIHSFRRYNRTRIYRCLSMVLRRVWELRFCGEDANPMEDISYFAASLGKLQAQTPVPDFETEAERRIACGVRADSMAMDL